MVVISCFDGSSCGQQALLELGITPSKYYASEIDRHAMKVTQTNFPNTIQMGDVSMWRTWGIDWSKVDLILGGSPCQGFSLTGEQLAFDDPRSKLFFEFANLVAYVKGHNPNVKFMLENVRMKAEYLNVISRFMGVEPMAINSNVLSACNRPRNYWFNWHVEQPINNHTYFLDVVDTNSVSNIMGTGWHEWWERNKVQQLSKQFSAIPGQQEKGVCFTARMYGNWKGNFIKTSLGLYRKPTKSELAQLCGLPTNYFDCTSQRQTEIMTGNGWTIQVIKHILGAKLWV